MVEDWLDTPFNLTNKRVWVAGHTGMVGAATTARLQEEGCELVTPSVRIDLREQGTVRAWVQDAKLDVIVLAAAKVGGIYANATQPADFIYDNMMIEANIIKAAQEAGVAKLLFIGSSCIYPKDSPQPIVPEALLSGPLEPTNEAYAVAKIAGIKLCQAMRAQHGCDFITVMPCNLYGPGDTYDEEVSHVIPALMMKAHAAKIAGARTWSVWGSGTPLREFLFVNDFADALVYVLTHYSSARPLNIGAEEEISIADLARLIAQVVGLEAEIVFDQSKPDGVMRKVMDSSEIYQMGWYPLLTLFGGLQMTYDSLCAQLERDSKMT